LWVLLLHPQAKLALKELMEKKKSKRHKNLKTSLMDKQIRQTQDSHMHQPSFKLMLGIMPKKFQFQDSLQLQQPLLEMLIKKVLKVKLQLSTLKNLRIYLMEEPN
jgi:hypothetical protein